MDSITMPLPSRPLGAAKACPGPRLFAVEDDPLYARMLRHAAESMGASLDVFDPDADFDRLPLDSEYDAALVDYDLGHLNGAQIAALYAETPVILISVAPPAQLADVSWPRSVRTFVSKRRGARTVVEAGIELARRPGPA